MNKFLVIFCLLLAAGAVSARRITKQKRVLTQDVKSDFEAASAALANAPALKLADIKKFFNSAILFAANLQNGKSARRKIGTYESVGIRRTCTNGNCGQFTADVSYSSGAKGDIEAVYTPARNGKPESYDIEFTYYWSSCTTSANCMTHLRCLGVGTADTTKCAFSTYQDCRVPARVGSGYDLYNSAPKFSESDAPKYMKKNDIRLSKTGLLVVREYYEPYYGQELTHTIRHIRATFSPDAFITESFQADGNYIKTTAPDVDKLLTTVTKAKILTTEQILKKFFTEENIDLARMQGGAPVKKVIGAYNTAQFNKVCNNGICAPYKLNSLVAGDQFGGEGSVTLSCTTPQDLSKSVCDIMLTMKGGYGWEYQTFVGCKAVGNTVTKCEYTTPSYFRLKKDQSTDRSFWDRQDFVRDVTESNEFYFTDNYLVSRIKYRGIATDKHPFVRNNLVFTDLITYSTPFGDFASAEKTNCLSKANADDVLKNASTRPKYNKIVLQKAPVEALIKSAPYKSVDEAITKISGIGPVNVVYVSFYYNFFC